MNNKALSGIICCAATVLTFFSQPSLKAISQEYTVGEVQSLIDGIVEYKLDSVGAGSIQEWINGGLTNGAGTASEWYIMTLSQNGQFDFSAYESALSSYLAGHNESSATSREKYALALTASGSSNSYISDILDDSIGEQGIMSYIYGLHVLNNGYTCSRFNADDVVDHLLSMQYSDGGWAIFGDYGDIDVTAMTISSLAPYYYDNSAVHDAVERGIDFLSSRQEDNGGYQSFGTPNPESASQVLVAASSVGIDCVHDERFIKNGNNLIDGIAAYRLPDGSFSHTADGGFNETATIQALYSLIAYKRMCEGCSPLFVFDNRQPAGSAVQQNDIHSQQSQQNESTENDNIQTEKASAAMAAVTSTGSVSSAVSTSFTSAKLTTSAKIATEKSTSQVIAESKATETNSLLTSAKTTTNTEKQPAPVKENNTKTKIIIVILGSAAVLSLILLALGKKSYKNFIFIIIAAGGAIAVVLFTDIKSADEYYSGNVIEKDDIVGSVTLEIRCDTIVGKSDSEYIPDDGTILAVTDFDIEEGDTVFDILTEAAQTYGIQMENKGSSGSAHGMVYIAGINYIYEFDYGDLSGWVYHVNGITPSRNCGEYILSDGDEIQWLYTCELGRDLDEVYEE